VSNAWNAMLELIHERCSDEDFRRWFGQTAYASDSGDQITVWVPSEGVRRHIERTFSEDIKKARIAIGREDALVRFVVAGFSEGEETDDV
jgi:chromosomal replication initiation ATPase DnaA